MPGPTVGVLVGVTAAVLLAVGFAVGVLVAVAAVVGLGCGVTVGVNIPSSRKTIEGFSHQLILLKVCVEAVGVAAVFPGVLLQAVSSILVRNKPVARRKRPARLPAGEPICVARLSSQRITCDTERDLLMKKTPVNGRSPFCYTDF